MEDIYSDTEVYHPLAVVGKGTFGKVLQCWRGSDGELVALKAMTTDCHQRGLVNNELRLMAALGQSDVAQSHIVRFFESFRNYAQYYLVFEMLEKNLHEFQRENGFRPLPVRHIRTVSCQLLRALAKLKEMAIIHGDIKPENIMIVDQANFPFRVKLIDFGSGSFFKEVRFVKEPYIQSRFYRSPEILLGLPFCEKVDMWSLGCVMAELYLGWPLYPGDSEFEQVRYICETQGLPSPHLLNTATKTCLFFRLTETAHGRSVWQLRPTGQNIGPDAKASRTPERRKYVLKSLNQLYSVHGPEDDQAFRKAGAVAEAADRYCMVEFIKRALAINSHSRIVPNAALRHAFITMTHLRSSETQGYYELSLQELQKALIPKRSCQDHSISTWNPTAGPQAPPPSYRDQHVKDISSKLSTLEEASHHCSEGDHHCNQKIHSQSCCDGTQYSDKRLHDLVTCSDLQPVGAPWHIQVENIMQKMGPLSIADTEEQEHTPASWFGDIAAKPIQNAATVNELRVCPHSINAAQTEIASMLTLLNDTTQSIEHPHVPPSCSVPASNLFYMPHSGSTEESASTASSGVSQEMLFTLPPSNSPEEPCDPPQFFTSETLPNNQELSSEGQRTHQLCSHDNLECPPPPDSLGYNSYQSDIRLNQTHIVGPETETTC
ncbi:homeodomain-interacting protein kinase 4-like [Salminus brasiliensis]|uniref:homeodomain-interacting protein kinase 4-like n=1 Tax=Salminus brasiliensis TaxID=930266 RepID=UPI003B839E7F